MKNRIINNLNNDNIKKTLINAFNRKIIIMIIFKIIENTPFENLNAFI